MTSPVFAFGRAVNLSICLLVEISSIITFARSKTAESFRQVVSNVYRVALLLNDSEKVSRVSELALRQP